MTLVGGLKKMITIIDSPCGAGKTMWALKHMNESGGGERFIFITPFLSECERVINSCPSLCFVQPTNWIDGTKMSGLIDLINHNRNIVSTHALFSMAGNDILSALSGKNYTLIIDEAMPLVNKLNIYDDGDDLDENTYSDVFDLIECGILKLSGGGDYRWDDKYGLRRYKDLRKLCENSHVNMVEGSTVVWSFPDKMFAGCLFKNIYIMSYQFDYQIHSYYFKYYNIKYERKSISASGNLEDFTAQNDYEFRRGAKKLIHICENSKLNSIGSGTSLSKNWYKAEPEKIECIRKNVTNYWKNICNAPGREQMWATFKFVKSRIAKGSVSNRNFIAINSRATNDFANKKYLCYIINRYLNPFFIHFFSGRGIKVDQDNFALSELVQWIWRSAIRNGEEIYLYIPSERMRNLLKKWLDI